MAFENVEVSSLKNAINSCRNTIDYNNCIGTINDISSGNIWNSSSRDNLKKALDTLTNERYKALENKLDQYMNIADLIEEYKILEQENKNMEQEIAYLQPRLYYEESYTVTHYDSDGDSYEETRYRTVKDYGVENQINHLNRRINENRNQMEALKNRVASMIY